MPQRMKILEFGTALLVGVTIVAFAAGSSSVPRVAADGHKLRWAALGLLTVFAAAWAWSERLRAGARLDLRFYALPVVLLTIAALSTGWSIVPRTTAGRTISVAFALAAAASIAYASRGNVERMRLIAVALVCGAITVTFLGLVVLVMHRGEAIQDATPPRFRGFGENANTVSLLAAIALPMAVMLAFTTRTTRARTGWWVGAVSLAAMVVASGSRGAWLGATAGICLYALARPVAAPRRVALAGASLVVLAIGAVISTKIADHHVPPPASATPPASTTTSGGTTTPGPVSGAPGRTGTVVPPPTPPHIPAPPFNGITSGRMEAWVGAVERADRRPVLGYGFGSEETAFVDRYHTFEGGHVENSYLGMYLQLGALGVAVFVAFGLLVLVRGVLGWRRSRGHEREIASGFLAAFVTAALSALVLSYLYSVGNIAMVTVTVCAFMLGALGRTVTADG